MCAIQVPGEMALFVDLELDLLKEYFYFQLEVQHPKALERPVAVEAVDVGFVAALTSVKDLELGNEALVVRFELLVLTKNEYLGVN